MPEYVLNRNYTHRSTLGHIVNFAKGQPVYVPPALEREVTALGAEPVTGARVEMIDAEKAVDVVPVGTERATLLMAAYARMEARNMRGDFTGQGRPNVKVLKELVGFEVEVRERDDIWEEFMKAKAEA